MKRVTGIGGIFFKSDSPDQLYTMVRKAFGDYTCPRWFRGSF